MDLKIMLLNTMKYEKEGKWNSRIGYIIPTTDAFSNTEKFRGYAELSAYRSDTKFFDLIPREWCGQQAEIKVIEKPVPSNPMKTTKEIVSISKDGKVISLV